MNASSVSGVLTTAGLICLAGMFAWKGDAPHAMVCIVALLPAAPPSVANAVAKAAEVKP